jgi:hypothetical protein
MRTYREHCAVSKEAKRMTAALGTLPFLATLWLLLFLSSRILEESGAKIAAALKGIPPSEPPVWARCRMQKAMRPSTPLNVDWRAAA